jgi:hypothetical protein
LIGLKGVWLEETLAQMKLILTIQYRPVSSFTDVEAGEKLFSITIIINTQHTVSFLSGLKAVYLLSAKYSKLMACRMKTEKVFMRLIIFGLASLQEGP